MFQSGSRRAVIRTSASIYRTRSRSGSRPGSSTRNHALSGNRAVQASASTRPDTSTVSIAPPRSRTRSVSEFRSRSGNDASWSRWTWTVSGGLADNREASITPQSGANLASVEQAISKRLRGSGRSDEPGNRPDVTAVTADRHACSQEGDEHGSRRAAVSERPQREATYALHVSEDQRQVGRLEAEARITSWVSPEASTVAVQEMLQSLRPEANVASEAVCRSPLYQHLSRRRAHSGPLRQPEKKVPVLQAWHSFVEQADVVEQAAADHPHGRDATRALEKLGLVVET